ncbi:TPA: hypothetical protein NJZ05_004504 [Vibrio parahaemolyticus]|nr:hypothetical protein [Vibrio parahaemolyticus]
MSSQIFQSLVKDRVDNLIRAYETSKDVFLNEETKRLIHPGEYGEYREKAVIELLQLFIPQNLKISEGFVITSQGDVSTQCDIVIYDPMACPQIMDSALQNFFPVESVIAVGEVKSDIKSTSQLTEILKKLAKIKALKEKVEEPSVFRSYKNEPFTPESKEFDQIYTFVIAKSLPVMPSGGYPYSNSVMNRHKHNMLMAIENGHGCYKTDQVPNYYYPQTARIENQQVWRPLQHEKIPSNFGMFLSSLFNHCQVSTLLELDIVRYCSDNVV